MIATAYIMPFMVGFFVLRLISRRGQSNNVLLDIFLAWGIGVGVVSQVALYSVLIVGRCVPELIILFEGVVAVMLFGISFRRPQGAFCWKKGSTGMTVLIITVLVLLFFLALHLSYGGYDAWSLWNYRAASVFRGGDVWMAVFHNQVQGKHPWLLPFFTVWGWSIAGRETFWIPIVTAVVMATATIGLLVADLGDDAGPLPAIMAGLLLVSIPFFTWHSVSQYASIFVAYYALAAAVCFRKADENSGVGWGILSAMFLGFLGSSKDEGIILVVLFLMVAWAVGFGKCLLRQRFFWCFFTLTTAGMLITEVLMRTEVVRLPFVTSLNQHIDFTRILDVSQWKALVVFFWKRILHHPEFGRMWLWLPLILFGLSQRFVRFISLVLVGYFFIFAVLYVMATDPIVWRLGVSLNRLVFHVMPLLVLCAMLSVVRSAKE